MTSQDPAAAIDDAVARTDDLADVPLAEHVGRFDAVHVALNDALSRVDRIDAD
ncbi:MAG TPA: hypothetical protein VH969_15980 [Actinophytocola sp.]|jgi:hypothetical protein|uniref:hypothetical protein n=1 Tax=Actinophytocola sp. TaxID=1872138 RepID=UPI002F940143